MVRCDKVERQAMKHLLTLQICKPCTLLLTVLITSISVTHASAPEAAPTERALTLTTSVLNDSLKKRLQSCATADFYATDFAIAHRGAPLGYPEHSREGYTAAAKQGAGIIECDVTFTKDLELVCRHSQCDLATTTNILQTPLAAKCSKPFQPANGQRPASATCCTSDITLTEFKTLCARPDRSNKKAKTLDEFLVPLMSDVVPSPLACGRLVTHAESIELINTLGRKFIPELKRPEVAMPFAEGFDQAAYADKMLAEYRSAGIAPKRVFPQSFDLRDVWHWIENHPDFAEQVVWLDPRGRQRSFRSSPSNFEELKAKGLNRIAPPLPVLLTLNDQGKIIPSAYAIQAKSAGLDIITWTFESGNPTDPNNWLYASIAEAMSTPGQMLEALHVLAKDVGVKGVFADWPGTVTYYANCLLEPGA